jgi:hypothetical protein
MSDETESSTDASDTYAQIVVPSYSLASTVADASNMVSASATPVTTGSSFLRLGSFPGSSDQPSGYTNSLALAQLVGGSGTSLSTSEANDDATPSALLSANDYAGDSAYYLLGFADDTRVRPSGGDLYIDWVSVSDTTATRTATASPRRAATRSR